VRAGVEGRRGKVRVGYSKLLKGSGRSREVFYRVKSNNQNMRCEIACHDIKGRNRRVDVLKSPYQALFPGISRGKCHG
jgi:hypothetical protein